MGRIKISKIGELKQQVGDLAKHVINVGQQMTIVMQEFGNLVDYVNGAMQEFGRQLYVTSAIQAAMIEHLGIDEQVKVIVERRQQEAREADEKAAAELKTKQAAAVEAANAALIAPAPDVEAVN
jgi:glutamate dehydrogenase/leucine dehydrogenase